MAVRRYLRPGDGDVSSLGVRHSGATQANREYRNANGDRSTSSHPAPRSGAGAPDDRTAFGLDGLLEMPYCRSRNRSTTAGLAADRRPRTCGRTESRGRFPTGGVVIRPDRAASSVTYDGEGRRSNGIGNSSAKREYRALGRAAFFSLEGSEARSQNADGKGVTRMTRRDYGVSRQPSRQLLSSCRLSRNKPSIGTDEYYLHKMKEILNEFKSSSARPSPTKILDHLYVGSCWDANNTAYLGRLRIDHVLNCAAQRRAVDADPYDPDGGVLRYMGVPALDDPSYDMLQHVDRTNAFIAGARQRGGRVLVHCVMGINRSGFVVAAYLIGVLRMTLLGAVRLLKDKRCTVLCNAGFRRQLVWYARKKGLF